MKKVNVSFTIMNAIGSFVKIIEPVEKMNGDGKEYSIQLVISKDDPGLPALKKAILGVAAEAFPEVPLKDLKLGLRDGDDEGKKGVENCHFINARRPEEFGAVPVYNRMGRPITPDHDTVFSGCIFNAQVTLFAYGVSGSKGIGAGIDGLQIVDNTNVARLDNSVDLGNVFKPLDDDTVTGGKPEAKANIEESAEKTAEQEIPW